MICGKCDKDLAECTCPDLKERFEGLLKVKELYIGGEYQIRIQENIRKQEQKRQAEGKK